MCNHCYLGSMLVYFFLCSGFLPAAKLAFQIEQGGSHRFAWSLGSEGRGGSFQSGGLCGSGFPCPPTPKLGGPLSHVGFRLFLNPPKKGGLPLGFPKNNLPTKGTNSKRRGAIDIFLGL